MSTLTSKAWADQLRLASIQSQISLRQTCVRLEHRAGLSSSLSVTVPHIWPKAWLLYVLPLDHSRT
jgi:hypothetical protein